MSEGLRLFFAFFTLVVIAILVIAMLNNPKGTTALSGGTIGALNNTLKILENAQRPTPGQ